MLENKNSKTKICVLSNIIFGFHYISLLAKQFGYYSKVFPIPYGEHNEDEYSRCLSDSDLIIVWLNFENLFLEIYNYIDSGKTTHQQIIDEATFCCERLCADIARYNSTRILWFSFEDYYRLAFNVKGCVYDSLIDQLNAKLNESLLGKVTFINLKHLIAEVGVFNAYDTKGKYRWNTPYSKVMIEAAVKEIHKQYLIEKGITKKCLVLDCDNVLWGGIFSEDGLENLKLSGSGLGRVYQDFQRFVLSLYYHGVILAVCSKNNLSDVLTMFREHSEMILKEEHIACFQVDWEDKPSNIKKIAEKLNISLDSMVFVDDSPIEIEAVKAMLPEVTSILFERDMNYQQFSCFNLKNTVSIAEVEKRNETYRTNACREELKAKYADYTDYIKSLEINMDIHEATPIEYSRISELTQRTNKCTNGRRYTVSEIKERMVSDRVKLYSVSVSDRFSDLGLVGAIEIEGDVLTLFSLSCRALGREIEVKMLNYIRGQHQINSIEYHPTGKNKAMETLLSETFPNSEIINRQSI